MDRRNKNKWSLCGFVVVANALAVASWNAFGADAERGRMLHDAHCVACHDSRVYKREDRRATNYEEIRAQVVRWQSVASRNWNDGDVDAVTTYLARTFYMVPCPVC